MRDADKAKMTMMASVTAMLVAALVAGGCAAHTACEAADSPDAPAATSTASSTAGTAGSDG